MAVTFNPLAFLRSAPNYLLREYFTRKGLLGHVEWDHLGEYDMEPIFQAIVALPEEVQDSVMHDFRDLHARTRDGGFVKAILDEATYHKVDTDLAERFERMKRHLERTFWIFLHRKEQYWDGANIFWRVDKLTGASQWQARESALREASPAQGVTPFCAWPFPQDRPDGICDGVRGSSQGWLRSVCGHIQRSGYCWPISPPHAHAGTACR